MATIPRLVLAAPSSGCGKSTIAAGLMALWARGRTVQGFKVGPDYLDPMYHSAATGRISRNLDTWLVSPEHVRAAFVRASAGADLAVIEGVMGLFDGYDGAGESGSTAEVAKLLHAPVVLVLDVARMARTAGAFSVGCRDYDPAIRIAGIICNRVAGTVHAKCVTRAIEDTGVPVLGCVPKADRLRIPERHLGLFTTVERPDEVREYLDRAARMVAENVDTARLLALAGDVPAIPRCADTRSRAIHLAGVRLAVARDEAFCFYYEDNLDLLRDAGAEIVFFSPLRDAALPPGSCGLYLGGGYPELYAARLSRNTAMLESIRGEHQRGLPIYAECGGLMILTQSLTDLEGHVYPMLGLIPGHAQMCTKLVMGYRQVTSRQDTLLLPRGESVRGHEFHYSEWAGAGRVCHAYEVAPRAEGHLRLEGFAAGNLLASYIHLHFEARPEMAARFVSACSHWRDRHFQGSSSLVAQTCVTPGKEIVYD